MNRFPPLVRQPSIGGWTRASEENDCADVPVAMDSERIEAAARIQPLTISERGGGGSTDVADVSWAVATGGMNAATWVPGTSAHSWQAVAAGGTSIGNKGMIVAAKTLAMTAIDLLTNPELVESVKTEHRERIPEGWEYVPLLGNRAPPLDYRLPPGPR